MLLYYGGKWTFTQYSNFLSYTCNHAAHWDIQTLATIELEHPSWRIGVRTCSRPAWTWTTWRLSGNSLQTCFVCLGTDTSKRDTGWKFSLCLWGRLCHYFIYYFDCFANKLQIISGSSACVCCVFCILLCLGEGDTILCHAVILSVWHSSWCPASVISEIKLIKTIADFSFLLGLWFYTYVVCKQHQLWSDKKKNELFPSRSWTWPYVFKILWNICLMYTESKIKWWICWSVDWIVILFQIWCPEDVRKRRQVMTSNQR